MSKLDPEIENTILGTKGMLNFFDQFGKDIYAQIFFEELLEGIMNEEDVFVFGEQKQTGDQVDHSASGERGSSVPARSGGTATPTELGA